MPGGEKAVRRVTKETERGSRRRVLIVDDNAAVRESTADILKLVGYEVLHAGDHDQAVEYLTVAMSACSSWTSASTCRAYSCSTGSRSHRRSWPHLVSTLSSLIRECVPLWLSPSALNVC
jgi:PleD family two-component response regulator